MVTCLEFLSPNGDNEAVDCDKLHGNFDHVIVWQQTLKLAGEAELPYGIIGCCESTK